MHFLRFLFTVLLCALFVGCKQDQTESSKELGESDEAALDLEKRREERKQRRLDLERDRALYEARLQRSSDEYTSDQSASILESNRQIFEQRREQYIQSRYLPLLQRYGLKMNPRPGELKPANANLTKVGINFCSLEAFVVAPDQLAGVSPFAQKHWNNIAPFAQEHANDVSRFDDRVKGSSEQSVSRGAVNGLISNRGESLPSIELAWEGRGPVNWWSKPVADADGSLKLMGSHLEGRSKVTVKGLNKAGFQRYDVIVYIEFIFRISQQDGDNIPLGRVDLWSSPAKKKLLASDFISATKVKGDLHPGQIRAYSHQPVDERLFICGNTGRSGHYLYFSDLASPDLHLDVYGSVFGYVEHVRLSGIQLIQRQ